MNLLAHRLLFTSLKDAAAVSRRVTKFIVTFML